MLRIVFMGTPEIACPTLQALVALPDAQVVGVVVQPDKPKGRDLKLQPPPVKELALRLGLPVLQPERARNETFLAQLREWRPDLIAVLAYGQILPPALLEIPLHGCLNVHTSLLPRWRGAAPIQWAILAGDAQTGVTIMRMDAGLDTGGIVATRATPTPPPSPGTLSTATGTPHASLNFAAKMRPTTSVALPGVKPTTTRTALLG